MNNIIAEEKNRLEQTANLCSIRHAMAKKPSEMVMVYCDHNDLDDRSARKYWHNFYPVMVPDSQVNNVLQKHEWNARFSSTGIPSEVIKNGISCYSRFGLDNGMEPLVICRNFHGIEENYNEISEEFRLFHNLYYDKSGDKYVKINDAGDAEDVISTVEDKIFIRLNEIKQFLAVKGMHLSIQFHFTEYSNYILEELGLSESKKIKKDSARHYDFSMTNDGLFFKTTKSFSNLKGKYLISPYPKEKSGFWGYGVEEKKYENFIIGENDEGDAIEHTCEPDSGKEYLTPVEFKKTVLNKYYREPDKYRIAEGSISCGHIWGMDIDNFEDDKVCAWLGDLGRDLPHSEQLHWKSHNVVPTRGMSHAFAANQLLSIPVGSASPEHVFKEKYLSFNAKCIKEIGWPLFKELARNNSHNLSMVRVPADNTQNQFDDLVLCLAKVLVDSINVANLRNIGELSKTKEIDVLEEIFRNRNIPDYDQHVRFLRKLQALRSKGSAHLKGRDYDKALAYFKPGNESLSEVFKNILQSAIDCIDFLDSILPALKR